MAGLENTGAMAQLVRELADGDLPLPPMPAQALKIQRMIDDINVSIDQIVAAVSSDPALVAQLIKGANSSLYADKPRTDSVQSAVSRLGFKFLRNLVVAATMNGMDVARRPAVRAYLDRFWEHSREVAAISHFLAKNLRRMDPNQAALVGLVHDIGTIPICVQAEKLLGDGANAETLDALCREHRTRIGSRLLSSWEFQPYIVEAIAAHEDFHREAGEENTACTDILTVANQLSGTAAKFTDWRNIPAVARLALPPDELPRYPEIYRDEWRAIRETLFQ